MPLKIYYTDFGWAGATMVVAASREDAIRQTIEIRVPSTQVYNRERDIFEINKYIKEYEIVEGLVIDNIGDQ